MVLLKKGILHVAFTQPISIYQVLTLIYSKTFSKENEKDETL